LLTEEENRRSGSIEKITESRRLVLVGYVFIKTIITINWNLKAAEIDLALKIAEGVERKSDKKDLIMKVSRRWNNVWYYDEIRLISEVSSFGSFGLDNVGEEDGRLTPSE
jgi:hypothetical protein